MTTYYGELTETVQAAIALLVEPGEEFDVADICSIVEQHTMNSGKAGVFITAVTVGKLVNTLSRRGDGCLTNVSRGRYLFHGFGQDVVTGGLRQPRNSRPEEYCPTCHMVIPSSGVCGVCE